MLTEHEHYSIKSYNVFSSDAFIMGSILFGLWGFRDELGDTLEDTVRCNYGSN